MTLAPKTASLFRRVLRNMALRIAFASIALSAISYYYSYVRLQDEALANLAKYIDARSRLESELFLQAETNTKLVRDEFLRRYTQLQETDVSAVFDQLIKQDRDSMWRVRPELDDFEHKAAVAIIPTAKRTPEFKRQVLLGYDLLSQYGPAFRNRYYDLFLDLNISDASLMYLPDLNYARNGSVADFSENIDAELLGTPARNPERKTLWTGIYFDKQALQWMVSAITPIDFQGNFIGSVGQDVLLDQLINRTNNIYIPGTHNLIMTRDGKLIAHPERMEQIRKAQGQYDLLKEDEPLLRDIYSAVSRAKQTERFVESSDGVFWLGVTQIEGANWQFVTVYPKRLLQEKAAIAASMVLLLGILALAIELGLMAWVLRCDVAKPLLRLRDAIAAVRDGKKTDLLDVKRDDELGAVARAFDAMADTVQLHRQHLEELVLQRTEELAKRNRDLEIANIQLTGLNQEKNDLLAIAAHDLKNPVASIKGMANLLAERLEKWPPEKIASRLLSIGNLADRTQRIIGNLLDINALESGLFTFNPRVLPLDGLIVGLIKDWETRFEAKQQVCMWVSNDLSVFADQQALIQVLDNLISNASKYAPHESTIQILTEQTGNTVRITVRDQGPGIASHEMGRLFQKFSKLSAMPTGGEHATGLGLSIVKRLVEDMQGQVRCETQLGHGAAFIIELPAVAPA